MSATLIFQWADSKLGFRLVAERRGRRQDRGRFLCCTVELARRDALGQKHWERLAEFRLEDVATPVPIPQHVLIAMIEELACRNEVVIGSEEEATA